MSLASRLRAWRVNGARPGSGSGPRRFRPGRNARMPGVRRQQGVAVIVAVLVVALATSTVSYMLWHQSLWVRQVENLVARTQADAIARAAANWAAAILAADNRTIDHLGEAWARPIPPLAAESAQLAGTVADEQAKFNVNNLVQDGGAASPADVVAFQRLLVLLGLPPELAEPLVDWLDADDAVTAPNGAESAYYLALDPPYRAANRRVVDLGELVRVKGFSPEILARLAPYVTALPVATPVNVNTASAVVLQAILPTLSSAQAAAIVQNRIERPYPDPATFLRELGQTKGVTTTAQIDVKSRFFSSEVSVQLARVTVAYRSLFDRGDQGTLTPTLVTQSQHAL